MRKIEKAETAPSQHTILDYEYSTCLMYSYYVIHINILYIHKHSAPQPAVLVHK